MNAAALHVNVNDWDDNHVRVPLWQLLQWKHAIALEDKGLRHSSGRSVTQHVRDILSAPGSFPREELLAYLTATIEDVYQQLGLAGEE